jgi:hypothetical protein
MFYFRDFLVRNFMVNPKALLYKNKLIYFNGMNKFLWLLFRILPFYFVKTLLGLCNIGIIYKLDSIYNLTNNQQNHIVPIILNFLFIKENNGLEIKEDALSKIKYYNCSVPLHFMIQENNLEDYNKIKIKYLNKGNLVDKIVDINDFIKSSIYKLFEN